MYWQTAFQGGRRKRRGKYFYKISPYYPSSQICSVCNNIDKKYKNLDERIKKLNVFNDTAVIMESTGIYQMPVKKFFKENNYNLYVINPI